MPNHLQDRKMSSRQVGNRTRVGSSPGTRLPGSGRQHLIRWRTVAPILRKHRFAPRYLRAAPKSGALSCAACSARSTTRSTFYLVLPALAFTVGLPEQRHLAGTTLAFRPPSDYGSGDGSAVICQLDTVAQRHAAVCFTGSALCSGFGVAVDHLAGSPAGQAH